MNTTNSPLASVPLFHEGVLTLDLYLAIVLVALFSIFTLDPRVLALLPRSLSLPSSRVRRDNSSPNPLPLPHVSSAIPWIGHLLQLRRSGGRYIHQLILTTPEPLFTIDILSKKLIVANPSLDRALARHVHDTSLAQVISFIGKRSLNMGDEAVRTIAEYDPRPVHAQLFGSSHGAASLAEAATTYVHERLRRQPPVQEVQLGLWMFNVVVGASAHGLWGPQNPWNADKGFMEQFIVMSDCFESLAQPLPWLTARPAYRARELLVDRLMAFHRAHRDSRRVSMAHRINAIAMNDPNWEDNVDYYRCELLEALGLLVTASTLSVWLLRYLLVDDELRRKVVAEVRRLKTVPAAADDDKTSSGRLDLDDIRTTCPHLVAAWYETLRLRVTMVPRIVSRDFTLPMPSSPVAVPMKKHDVVLLPMLPFNLDAATWGPDAASFRAERFVDAASGRLSTQLTRKVRGFGVAGNLCPGRAFGSDAAMAAAATLLRDFDVEGVTGQAFPEPRAMRGANVGFERLAGDVRARLVRVGCRTDWP
ncbi:Uncharacterized protein TPAR_04832 [Tolypocladium paradoxum]|uniref:25-hydroxycholesterol 7-alpha-hydroxylase n=1 Tax=Tolypocladium paradoxum TaxID=94208 RepID=A0A2S4KXT8_9HYPO|nr:Uncharacterized protein TPAR_04832 [Tolypocladium paradoxum]